MQTSDGTQWNFTSWVQCWVQCPVWAASLFHYSAKSHWVASEFRFRKKIFSNTGQLRQITHQKQPFKLMLSKSNITAVTCSLTGKLNCCRINKNRWTDLRHGIHWQFDKLLTSDCIRNQFLASVLRGQNMLYLRSPLGGRIHSQKYKCIQETRQKKSFFNFCCGHSQKKRAIPVSLEMLLYARS